MIFQATKKDFKVDYFRCPGPGGQGINKVNSGCRITHIPSGLAVRSCETRDQHQNRKLAFERLAKLVVAWALNTDEVKHKISNDTIRTYHEPDNRVKDASSGLMQSYKEVVKAGNLEDMIEARRQAEYERNPNSGPDGEF